MARSKKEFDYNAPFPTRLRELIAENKDATQETIANICGTTRQTVGNWYSGATIPDCDSLAKIAVYFRVSSDYLLGISGVRSYNATLKNAQKYVGLSEEACIRLNDISHKYYGYSLDDERLTELDKNEIELSKGIVEFLSAFITDTNISINLFRGFMQGCTQLDRSIEILQNGIQAPDDDKGIQALEQAQALYKDYRLSRFDASDSVTGFLDRIADSRESKYRDCLAAFILKHGERNGAFRIISNDDEGAPQ